MMPGDSQAKTAAIAADATVGSCQNCSVLHQSLTEYVASFSASKQKIAVTDDSISLREQSDESQSRLVTSEKKTADYESLQAESEEKKCALKVYEQLSEEMEKLKQEKSNILAENKKLEDELKCLKDSTETKALENGQSRREKAAVENDLLKTQASLKESQEQAEKVDALIEEITIMTNMKDSSENKVGVLEDSVCKKNYEISQSKKEKISLERNISDLQVRSITSERERCKEYRSVTTQTRAEPKVDKDKVRSSSQSLWECVEPEQEQSPNKSILADFGYVGVLSHSPQTKSQSNQIQMPAFAPETIKESDGRQVEAKFADTKLKPFPRVQDACKLQVSASPLKQDSKSRKSKQSPKKNKSNDPSPIKGSHDVSIEEIMAFFKPMPTCISPLLESDASVETVEMDGEEKNDDSELSDDVPLPKQDQPSNSKTSLLLYDSQKSSLYKDDNVDVLEHISDKKNFGHSVLSDVTEQNENSNKAHENNSSLKNVLPSESPQCSLSNGDVPEEGFSLPAQDMEHSHSENSDNDRTENLSDTKRCFEEAKEESSETVTKMDEDVSPDNIPDPTAVFYGERVVTANSGEAEDKLCIEQSEGNSLEDTSVTKNQKDHMDSWISDSVSPAALVLPCKDSEIPEHSPPNSSDAVSCVLNKNIDEGMEINSGVHCEGDDGSALQGSREVNVTACSSDSNDHEKPLSLKKYQALTWEDKGLCSDGERGETNSTDSLPKDVDKEQAKSKLTPDRAASISPEKITVDSKSFEGDMHSVCRQLSPSCSLPQVKSKALEADPNTEKPHEVNTKQDAKDNSHTSDREIVNTLESDQNTSPSENSSVTKEQNKRLETLIPVHEQPGSHKILEAKITPVHSPVTAQTQEFVGHVLSEMGPPLPPVSTPLKKTPPKAGKTINPKHAIGKLSFPSPMDSLDSPTTPVKFHSTPNSQSLTSPTHPNGAPSSPSQFGSATPKHALPVPGRLPTKPINSSPSASPPQENSMRILGSMYPQMSARAWTLNILKGNVNLGTCSSENCSSPKTTDSQISGFKAISSTSTAFTKTETRGEKRRAIHLSQPKISKCPKLEGSSTCVTGKQESSFSLNDGDEAASSSSSETDTNEINTASLSIESGEPAEQDLIVNCLNKIKNQCFDLLPVVQSHSYVGKSPKKPVLRDEEKEVISEICRCSEHQVGEMIGAILTTLKAEKTVLNLNYLQALCRVYMGICRQKKYWEKARISAYCILVEDFTDSAKSVLFMVTTWPNVSSHSSLSCQAIHAITKSKAPEGLLGYLSAFLGWEKNPPSDIDQSILRTSTELRSGSNQSFTKHIRYGEDLGDGAWEQIFASHLSCSHKKWKWTYEHILGKELWPLMNTWVQQPRDQQEPVRDETIATVLRLIGRLGQSGLKESSVSSLLTVANIINTFGRHGQAEGVPWAVQLAAVYCIYELSPCNPKQASDASADWRGEAAQSVPPAVTSCINQIASICRSVRS